MDFMNKNSAAYELSDEIFELRRICRLSRDMAGDTYSHLSRAADRASSGDESASLIGVFSGAVRETGWKLEVLIELLCSLEQKLSHLEALSEFIDPTEDDACDSMESAVRILLKATGRETVSSKKLGQLYRILQEIQGGGSEDEQN